MREIMPRISHVVWNKYDLDYGYMFDIQNVVKHTLEVKKYMIPNGKITVTQWPEGTHYYARVDGEDVVLYGKKRWDSRDEAMKAALKFQQEEQACV
jgi:hypothetical protein